MSISNITEVKTFRVNTLELEACLVKYTLQDVWSVLSVNWVDNPGEWIVAFYKVAGQ